MAMTLELKHLAPYLPYNLKGLSTFLGERNIYTIAPDSVMICLSKNASIKPILRPISDLSLLVIEEFEKYDGTSNEEIINLFCEENTGYEEFLTDIILQKLPYECIEFIFRNHYDFFGLIPTGLAVSIHDVEQVIA